MKARKHVAQIFAIVLAVVLLSCNTSSTIANGEMREAPEVTKVVEVTEVVEIEETPVENIQYFSDVPTDYWAYFTIRDFVECSYIDGYEDGTFKPNKYATREEFAKILMTVAGIKVYPVKESSFIDVEKGSYFTPYVEAAMPYMTKWKNIETGALTFKPDECLTREELISVVVKMTDKVYTDLNYEIILNFFTDVDSLNGDSKAALASAVNIGLIEGYADATLRPNAFVTRAELCTILSRAFKSYDSDNYIKSYDTELIILEDDKYEVSKLSYVAKVDKDYTEEDLYLLAKVMQCEAGSDWITDEEQLMFGNVIMNRVASVEFPDTIREVVYQKGQYIPSAFERQIPTERTLNNARKLLEGYRILPESVVFQANFPQGSGTYIELEIDYLGTTYLCYANNMQYYQ